MIRERTKRSVVWKMSDSEFETLVETSASVGDICMKLSSRKAGAMFTNIQTRISNMGLKTNHFIDGRVGSYSPAHVSKEEFFRRMKNEEQMDFGWMKKKIIEFSLIPHKCYECSLTNEWNGKPLVLHLDHKDGDFTNNSLDNLRFLCPNCHSQTETFSVGTRKRKRYTCLDCKCETSGYGPRCHKCGCLERERLKKMVGGIGIEPMNQECHSCSLPLA